jgi:hypothetical protein
LEHPEATTQEEVLLSTQKSSVFRPSEPDEDTHPHACWHGLVFMTWTTFDEEVGDEVERIEVVPCRRCAEEGARA